MPASARRRRAALRGPHMPQTVTGAPPGAGDGGRACPPTSDPGRGRRRSGGRPRRRGGPCSRASARPFVAVGVASRSAAPVSIGATTRRTHSSRSLSASASRRITRARISRSLASRTSSAVMRRERSPALLSVEAGITAQGVHQPRLTRGARPDGGQHVGGERLSGLRRVPSQQRPHLGLGERNSACRGRDRSARRGPAGRGADVVVVVEADGTCAPSRGRRPSPRRTW